MGNQSIDDFAQSSAFITLRQCPKGLRSELKLCHRDTYVLRHINSWQIIIMPMYRVNLCKVCRYLAT